jgi:hypothetical protein
MTTRYSANQYLEIAHALVNILHDNGGKVQITQDSWNIYDEVADRLRLTPEDREKKTRGGEPALRATVGYVKHVLKIERIISDVPGQPGIWTLQEGPKKGLVWLMTECNSRPFRFGSEFDTVPLADNA